MKWYFEPVTVMIIVLVGMLFASSIVKAEESWTSADTNRELVYASFHVMDWAQTRNISRNPDKWYETNALLGRHPSTDKVDLYFLLTWVGHYLVADNLSPRNRKLFQNVTILLEAGYVTHNLSLGVNIKF